MKITTKHPSNSPITFVTHAILFFLLFCCANSPIGGLKTTKTATAKQKGIRLSNQNFIALTSHLFCTFLRGRWTTTTLNYLISRFAEDVNTLDQDVLILTRMLSQNSTPENWIHHHLTYWTTWIMSDEFWNSLNSLFQRPFHRSGRQVAKAPGSRHASILHRLCYFWISHFGVA